MDFLSNLNCQLWLQFKFMKWIYINACNWLFFVNQVWIKRLREEGQQCSQIWHDVIVSDRDSHHRFHSATSHSSTELSITDVRLSDSALYYCALRVEAQWYKTWDMSYKNLKLFSLWTYLKTTIYQPWMKNITRPNKYYLIKYVVTCVRQNLVFVVRHNCKLETSEKNEAFTVCPDIIFHMFKTTLIRPVIHMLYSHMFYTVLFKCFLLIFLNIYKNTLCDKN